MPSPCRGPRAQHRHTCATPRARLCGHELVSRARGQPIHWRGELSSPWGRQHRRAVIQLQERNVFLVDDPRLEEQIGQPRMRQAVPCDRDASAGAAIQPVGDPARCRPEQRTGTLLAQERQRAVGERALVTATSTRDRVREHVRRLAEHRHVLVLIQHVWLLRDAPRLRWRRGLCLPRSNPAPRAALARLRTPRLPGCALAVGLCVAEQCIHSRDRRGCAPRTGRGQGEGERPRRDARRGKPLLANGRGGLPLASSPTEKDRRSEAPRTLGSFTTTKCCAPAIVRPRLGIEHEPGHLSSARRRRGARSPVERRQQRRGGLSRGLCAALLADGAQQPGDVLMRRGSRRAPCNRAAA
mmetsp:Transcript_4094/g.16411  ORF Transcript_4094/g.16411 Transcript_4094/m.16411 type:complete len:355 (-) Transcript_4094:74-1138(-)